MHQYYSGNFAQMHMGHVCFNTTFNNISGLFWQSVLLVEETTDLTQVIDKLYHIKVVSSTPHH